MAWSLSSDAVAWGARVRRLPGLRLPGAPNRSGGAIQPKAPAPVPIRRQAMARNDGGSGSGTRLRSSVVRAAVSYVADDHRSTISGGRLGKAAEWLSRRLAALAS
jgi:hypothetical protein